MSEKLTLEEEISIYLNDDLKKNVLDFVVWLKANELALDSVYSSGFDYLDERVCIIDVHYKGDKVDSRVPLYIYFNGKFMFDPPNMQIDTDIKEFICENLKVCTYYSSKGKICGCVDGDKPPWNRFSIFGKDFDYLCHAPLSFLNPDSETFEKIKELVNVWKYNIDETKKV